jgi:hypothetical protein
VNDEAPRMEGQINLYFRSYKLGLGYDLRDMFPAAAEIVLWEASLSSTDRDKRR